MRVDKPSNLGEWSYEVLDTKLATETKVGAILQIALYSEIIGSLQENLPEYMHVMKPDGKISYRVNDYIAYVRMIKKLFLQAMQDNEEPYPDVVAHCDICNWWEECNKRRREDDHLSFVGCESNHLPPWFCPRNNFRCNETPWKGFMLNGITTISSDKIFFERNRI